MEVKKLYEMVDEDQKEGSLGEKAYWKDLWECYIGGEEHGLCIFECEGGDTAAGVGTESERTPSCGKLW